MANYILYHASVSCTKISILFFLNRIFVQRAFLMISRAIGLLVVGYLFAAVCEIFAFNPIEAQWKPWIPHTTINTKAYWIALGTTNTIIEVTILCMPQPIVWKLQMSFQRKMLLSMLFLLGGL